MNGKPVVLKNTHLQTFAKKVGNWQSLLGLYDWEIDATWDTDPETKNEASCMYNVRSRRATIYLSKYQDENLSADDINKAAFHEMLHLLLARLVLMAGSDHIDDFDIDEESHVIIARMTNLIFDREP